LFDTVTYRKTQMIEAVSNNLISIKDSSFVYQFCQWAEEVQCTVQKFDNFNILIENDGYIPFCRTYTRDEINLLNDKCNNTPLFVQLKKLPPNAVADVDGNVYKTTKIGEQEWMAENLRTTRFNDGFPILGGLESGGYDWSSEHGESFKKLYGYLYSGLAINSNICPAGWHIPGDNEWEQLVEYAGGAEVAGGKLKEEGTEHWVGDSGATNEFGFNALPGGYFVVLSPNHSGFVNIGFTGIYASLSGNWVINVDNNKLYKETYSYGASVRCIKD
jgi:uncharacterized protein (TIGR02145 family)